jgi:hypothetical protein
VKVVIKPVDELLNADNFPETIAGHLVFDHSEEILAGLSC